MNTYAGLDVSLAMTHICIVDAQGQVMAEQKVASEPDAIARALEAHRDRLSRVGVEASALGRWLQGELSRRGFDVVMIEAWHTHVSLSTMRNKTDRNDARGIAQLMRLGWFKAVHVKSAEAQRLGALLRCRKLVLRKLIDVENEMRGLLRAFGMKLGHVSRGRFAAQILKFTEETDPLISEVLQRLLAVRVTLLVEYRQLHKLVVRATLADPVCRRLISVPGVGPIAALAFRVGVDDPTRFARSRTVAAHFGLTPRKFQSGEVNYDGRMSRRGDQEVRQALYDAAASLLIRCRKWSGLRAWGLRIAKRGGMKKATVAVSRKLAVILHRMWVDGTEFRWTKEAGASTAPAA